MRFIALMEEKKWVCTPFKSIVLMTNASFKKIYALRENAQKDHTITVTAPSESQEEQRREHKIYTGTNAFLKNRPLLQELYNAS